MNRSVIYIVFIVGVVAIGALIGINNIPGEWYRSLEKPWFNPPDAIFGPVWTALYVMIGIAGARTWIAARSSARMIVWVAQMVLNFAWSPLFFGAQSPLLALAVIIPLLLCIFAFIALSREKDTISMWLFVPYAAWVSFATLLNGAIVFLN